MSLRSRGTTIVFITHDDELAAVADRTVRRAPARIIASVLAIALAVGAIGVLAVPDVAANSLRELAVEDRLAHVVADTFTLESAEGLAGP